MIDLREKRIAKGLTQEQLAAEACVVRTTISNIECGIMRPSVETAKLIAKALDFEWTAFFDEESA